MWSVLLFVDSLVHFGDRMIDFFMVYSISYVLNIFIEQIRNLQNRIYLLELVMNGYCCMNRCLPY